MIFNDQQRYKLKVVVIALMLLAVTTVHAVGEETPLSDGSTITAQKPLTGLDQYRGATLLTDTELASLLSLVGFRGGTLRLAWAIVMRESSGNPLSHNKATSSGDNSYGLFQINMIGHLGADRRDKFGIEINAELLDPVANAQAAFYMSARGTDFASWGLGPNAYDGTPSEPAVTIWLKKFPK